MTDEIDLEARTWDELTPDERRNEERAEILRITNEMRAEGRSLDEINRTLLLHEELVEEIESDIRVKKALKVFLESGLEIDLLLDVLYKHKAFLLQGGEAYSRQKQIQQKRAKIQIAD